MTAAERIIRVGFAVECPAKDWSVIDNLVHYMGANGLSYEKGGELCPNTTQGQAHAYAFCGRFGHLLCLCGKDEHKEYGEPDSSEWKECVECVLASAGGNVIPLGKAKELTQVGDGAPDQGFERELEGATGGAYSGRRG